MITCPACRHPELEGELFCSACGARLWASSVEPGPKLPGADAPTPGPSSPSPAPPPGPVAVALEADGRVLRLEGRSLYVLGRRGAAHEVPDVDLNPLGGGDRGVSRRHAVLRVERQQILLADLGSANGTWLNGTRLSPKVPIQVKDGDAVRLGQLEIRVRFTL